MSGRNLLLVVLGGGFLIWQFYAPVIPSLIYSFIVLALVPFGATILSSNWSILTGILPVVLMILGTYGWDIASGQMLLIRENLAILIVQLFIIAAVTSGAIMLGFLARMTLEKRA